MHFISGFVLSIFGIIGLSFAAPVSNSPIHTREWKDCTANTTFYVCQSNGFQGCCSTDPCHLSGCPDRFVGTPSSDPVKLPKIGGPQCTPGSHKLFNHTLHSIYSSYPDFSQTESGISLYQRSSGTSKHQIAIFNELPSRAKKCQLFWSAPHGKAFSVTGIGYTSVESIDTPVPSNVTWNSMQATEHNRVGGADFAWWPEDRSGVTDHLVGDLNCTSDVAFRIGLDGANEGSIDLAQDDQTGWNLRYEC